MEIKRYNRPKLPRNRYVSSSGSFNSTEISSSSTYIGAGGTQLTQEQLQFIYNLMGILSITTEGNVSKLTVNSDLTVNSGCRLDADDIVAFGDVTAQGKIRAGDDITAFFGT